MSWWGILDTCSWRGIEFEVQRIRDSLRHRIVAHAFPYRDGALHYDMGREARPTIITAIFMGSGYEENLSGLLTEVDKGLSGLFIHPILGNWAARLQVASIEHDADSRDMAVVELEVIEDGLDQSIDIIFSAQALIDNMDAANALLSALIAAMTLASQVRTAIGQVQSKIAFVKATVTSAVDQVDRAANDLRRLAKTAIDTAEDMQGTLDGSRIRRAVQLVVYRVDQVAAAAKLGKPRIIKREQRVEGPLVLATSNFAAAMRMNRIRNPLTIKPGDKLALYEEPTE